MNRRQFSQLAALAAVRAVSAQRQEPVYREKFRPQFHFSSKTGWINDPNGLVYYKGEYHLFFQHNPFGVEWGNMTWGHAVSPDMVEGNRDPKVVWHAGTGQWIMALFLDGCTFAFLASSDLRKWSMLQQISVPGVGECPDFFEMPVENEPGVAKWVWTGADGNYLVGSFDGKRFMPEVMTQPLSRGGNYYAAQTFSDLPGNRRVQMSWMRGGRYPGMPFNHQMSCPYEFRLRKYGYNSYRIFALPIPEIEALRETPRSWKNLDVKPLENPLSGIAGDLWDVRAEIAPGTAREVGFKIRGWTVVYTAKDNLLSSGRFGCEMPQRDGRITIRILVDRTTVETFGNDGEVVIPACFLPEANDRNLELFATGGAAKVLSLDICPLRSAWRRE